MSRRYSEPIRVWVGPHQGGAGAALGSVPVRFRWRWRTYVVTEVLGRWIEGGAWWPAVTAAISTVGARSPAASGPDRRVWRVEARTEGRTGVFDLCDQRPVDDTQPPAAPGVGDRRWLLLAAVD